MLAADGDADATAMHPASASLETERSERPIAWLVVTMLGIGAAAAAWVWPTIGISPPLAVLVVAVPLVPVWGIVAIGMTCTNWLSHDAERAISGARATERASQFATPAQRYSLVLTCALLANLASLSTSVVLGMASDTFAELALRATASASLAALALTLAAICVNTGWLFAPAVLSGERSALESRTGAWRVIRLARGLAVATWIGHYVGIAAGIAAIVSLAL